MTIETTMGVLVRGNKDLKQACGCMELGAAIIHAT